MDVKKKERNLVTNHCQLILEEPAEPEGNHKRNRIDLEKLYNTYKDKNFVIVGFPANNFGKQEPGTDTEIAEFCQQNYGVSFPMMTKTSVKEEDMNPVYQFLTQQSKNGFKDSEVAWNFQKYLIDENGNVVNIYPSKTLPIDAAIVAWIENK